MICNANQFPVAQSSAAPDSHSVEPACSGGFVGLRIAEVEAIADAAFCHILELTCCNEREQKICFNEEHAGISIFAYIADLLV